MKFSGCKRRFCYTHRFEYTIAEEGDAGQSYKVRDANYFYKVRFMSCKDCQVALKAEFKDE